MTSAGTPGFPAAPRELSQWCDISAGLLDNPMIQCLPPPHPTAKDRPLGTGVEGQWLDWWLPIFSSRWAGEDLPDRSLRKGKWPPGKSLPAPVGGWYVPCWQDTVVLWLLAHQEQESCALPCSCSPAPSSSPFSPNKSQFCSSVCFASCST